MSTHKERFSIGFNLLEDILCSMEDKGYTMESLSIAIGKNKHFMEELNESQYYEELTLEVVLSICKLLDKKLTITLEES